MEKGGMNHYKGWGGGGRGCTSAMSINSTNRGSEDGDLPDDYTTWFLSFIHHTSWDGQ